jgi:membrane-associated phospholipid phosphatase
MTRFSSARAVALGLGLACSSTFACIAQGKAIALDPLWDSVALTSGIGASLAAELALGSNARALPTPSLADLGAIDALACFAYDDGASKASLAATGLSLLWPALFAVVGDRGDILPAAVSCAEALAWTYAAKDLVKFLVPKARPYAYRSASLSGELLEEANQSFPSGHTALAFCAATSFAVLALELEADDPATPWLVAGGYAAATAAGALRVASGEHFISDVAAGALLGSAIGYIATAAHIRPAGRADEGLSLSGYPGADGPSLSLRLALR